MCSLILRLWIPLLLAIALLHPGCIPSQGALATNSVDQAIGDETSDGSDTAVSDQADLADAQGTEDQIVADQLGDNGVVDDTNVGDVPLIHDLVKDLWADVTSTTDTPVKDTPIDDDIQLPDDSETSTPTPPELLLGILGDAPGGTFTKICDLEVRNDLSLDRERELAWSSVPVAKIDDLKSTDGLVVVDDKGKWIQAQFKVISRWGGALDDPDNTSRPVRWLKVILPAAIKANQTRLFELRKYDTQPQANDPLALTVKTVNKLFEIDTGAATFTIQPINPALITKIVLNAGQQDEYEIYTHQQGAGPRLVLSDNTVLETAETYETSTVADVLVDRKPNQLPHFEILEQGPLQAVILIRGHFTSKHSEAYLACQGGTSDKIYRFGFSAVMTFTRASNHVDLQYNLRNECGDGGDDTRFYNDQKVTVNEASWVFPIELKAPQVSWSTNSDVNHETTPLGGVFTLTQHHGNSNAGPWKRRASVTHTPPQQSQNLLEESEDLLSPLLGLDDGNYLAAVQLSWMRYREPMGLRANPGLLSMLFIAEPTNIGEAKGIWNTGRLSIFSSSNPLGVSTLRDQGLALLERGLLVRLPLDQFNRTGVYPPMGKNSVTKSQLKGFYESGLKSLHKTTLGYPVHASINEPGQWKRAYTFGSQLWPDTPYGAWDPWSYTSPAENKASLGYGNPAGAELLEFYRTGEPTWVWEFALPHSYLLAYTGYYNTGFVDSVINTIGIEHFQTGIGDWHRGDEEGERVIGITFNGNLRDAYLIRPTPLLLNRFQQANSAFNSYYPGIEGQREWQNQVEFHGLDNADVGTGFQLFQMLEMLMNCAEFVPGTPGVSCLQTLKSVVAELTADNLTTGLMCSGEKIPTGVCQVRAIWLLQEVAYLSIRRYGTTLDPVGGKTLLDGMLETIKLWVEKLPIKDNAFDIGAKWYDRIDCTLSGGQVQSCAPNAATKWEVWSLEYPGLISLAAAARELDPSVISCDLVKNTFALSGLYASWENEMTSKYGWDYTSATLMQMVIFGIGALDECP